MCRDSMCTSILQPRYIPCSWSAPLPPSPPTMTHLGGNSGSAKEAGVLVHVERRTAHAVGLEHACAQVMYEPERGHDQRRRARELLPAIGGRIVPSWEGMAEEARQGWSRGEKGREKPRKRVV